MNMSELEKFMNKTKEYNIGKEEINKLIIDNYMFDPINEKATMSKGSQSVIIDLTKTTEVQESDFQAFINGLE